MLKDNFGAYIVTFCYEEPSNNKHYEFKKYVNSKKIKQLGVYMLLIVKKIILLYLENLNT